MYLPKIEPATPIVITNQMFKSNIICIKTIIVKAGGKGNGTTSKINAPKNTNTYFHHMVFLQIKLDYLWEKIAYLKIRN